MAHNIQISSNRSFSTSPVGSTVVTNWAFSVPNLQNYVYLQGDPVLPAVNIATIIKNYYWAAPNVGTIIIRASLTFDGSTRWANLSGPIFAATPAAPIGLLDKTGYQLDANNLSVLNTITFNNLQNLTQGFYNGNIRFSVFNSRPSNASLEFMEFIDYNFSLSVLSFAETVINPKTLSFSWLRGTPLPAPQNLQLTTPGNWFASTDKKLTLTAPGAIDYSEPSETIIGAVGNKTINVGIDPSIISFLGTKFETEIQFLTDNFVRPVGVVVNIIYDDVFVITPASLTFNAIKGITEAPSRDFSLAGLGAYTITHPSWLVLSATSGVHTGTFTVTPISAVNLSSGTYTGDITIIASSKQYVLPVTYIVKGFINTPLSAGNVNFTKDLDYLSIININRNADNLATLELSAINYSYQDFTETEKTFSYILPFFNFEAQEHVGSIVSRLFSKASGLQDFNFLQLDALANSMLPVLQPARVAAHVKLILRSAGTVFIEDGFQNMLFLPGKKPESFNNNVAILSFTEYPKRVTPLSFEILNFLVPAGLFRIEITVNTDAPILMVSSSATAAMVYRYVFNFSAYQAGDTVKVAIVANGVELSKYYNVILEGDQSFHIGFINQHHVLELLECTGALTVSSDISKITHTYYKNLVEHIETLDASKKMTLAVNSGIVFKEDQLIIDAILNSKKAWLIFHDKPAIELSAPDKKLTNYDSDQELYDFELEFNINRTHDVENYIF